MNVGVGFGAFSGSAVQHLGDVRMIHQRQRLSFGLEAGDDGLGVHPQLDDFERHAVGAPARSALPHRPRRSRPRRSSPAAL